MPHLACWEEEERQKRKECGLIFVGVVQKFFKKYTVNTVNQSVYDLMDSIITKLLDEVRCCLSYRWHIAVFDTHHSISSSGI